MILYSFVRTATKHFEKLDLLFSTIFVITARIIIITILNKSIFYQYVINKNKIEN